MFRLQPLLNTVKYLEVPPGCGIVLLLEVRRVTACSIPSDWCASLLHELHEHDRTTLPEMIFVLARIRPIVQANPV